jgi:hypothetical protein
MDRIIWGLPTAVSIVFLVSALGCSARPSMGPPGTISDQRNRAVLHDPYPSNDLGPPIVGGRPREFDLPRSEPAHLQSSPYAQRSRGGPVPPQTGF